MSAGQEDLQAYFSEVQFPKRRNLVKILAIVFEKIGIPFVFVIDEWDCIFRIYKMDLYERNFRIYRIY